MAENTQPSPELLAANERLLMLRQQQAPARSEPPNTSDAPDLPQMLREFSALPDHLGWGNAALTAVLRRSQHSSSGEEAFSSLSTVHAFMAESCLPGPEHDDHCQINVLHSTNWVKLYPDIGLGMLRQEKEAPGRLWFLLRHFDPQGQGSIRIDLISERFTNKSSSVYLCGKRQLRNLLHAGEGVYWTRDKERVWLRSVARVAASLGVTQLTGQPVALPLDSLLGGIRIFRAHLYAAFHSGRAKSETRIGTPVARATLAHVSGVRASSQRAYERQLNVQTRTNFAIGDIATVAGEEEQAWRHGQALFLLKDYDGQQGQAGTIYLAWQLPNSYAGQHPQRPRGRQKRINRHLKDLVTQGMPGNDGNVAENREPVRSKRYYPNGRLAGQARSGCDSVVYWRHQGSRNGRFNLWYSLGEA